MVTYSEIKYYGISYMWIINLQILCSIRMFVANEFDKSMHRIIQTCSQHPTSDYH